MKPYLNPSIYRTKLTRSALSRVAKGLGLSKTHVCAVANGHRTSARVEEAILQEYVRIEREVRRYERTLAKRAA